jgi:hypothetical protein
MNNLGNTFKLLALFSLLFLEGCFLYGGKNSDPIGLSITRKKFQKLNSNISSIAINNNQLIISGSGLSGVTNVKLQGDSLDESFSISSVSDSQVVAVTTRAVNLVINSAIELVIATADAQSTYPVTFTLQNGAVTGTMISGVGANPGQVLKYDGSKWLPGDLAASQTYIGAWDAASGAGGLESSPSGGDYYIVSGGATYNGDTYAIGDWIMYNATVHAWERIASAANNKLALTGGELTGDLILDSNLILKNSSNKTITIKPSASLASNLTLTLPTTNGTSGQVLTTNGSGTLSWDSLTSLAPVTSVNTQTGAVTLTTTDIGEGTNLYFTNARVASAPLTSLSTATNSAITASDTVLSAFGKLQAQLSNMLSTGLTSLSTATSAIITTGDSILSAFGKLQGQITTLTALDANKLSKNTADSITSTITVSGAGDIIVPTSPAGVTSAVNMSYVTTAINANGLWSKSGSNISYSAGNVGIGTTSPSALVHILKEGAGAYYSSASYRDSAYAGGFIFGHARGTASAPSFLNDGDRIASIFFKSFDGNAGNDVTAQNSNAATIEIFSEGASSGSSTPGRIVFSTTPSGATGVSERMRISSTGDVGIGTTTPAYKLDVNGSLNATSLYLNGTVFSPTSNTTTVATTGGQAQTISQTATNAATASRTALTLQNLGTGSTNEYNLMGLNAAGAVTSYISQSGVASFSSYVFSPIHYGNSTASADLTLDSTSNATKGNIILAPSGGNIGIGVSVPTSTLDITGNANITSSSANAFTVGQNGSSNPAFTVDASGSNSVTGLKISSFAAGSRVYVAATSSASNEDLKITSKGTGSLYFDTPGGGTTFFQQGGANRAFYNGYTFSFSPGGTSTATPHFNYTGAGDTAITASTEANNVYFNMGQTRQHATGALTLQRDFRIVPSTHSFVGASTLTNAATFAIDNAPSAGTNATITNSSALYIPSNALSGTIANSYGLNVSAPTGATNNYAATFQGGNVGIGTSSPSAVLDVRSASDSNATSGDFVVIANTTNPAVIVGRNSTTASSSARFSVVDRGNNMIFSANGNYGTQSAAYSYFVYNLGIGTITPAGIFDVSKTLSGTPSSTIGAYQSHSASTYTDSATATSGTATGMVFNSIASPTLSATNSSVTTTNASTFYIAGAPKAGTNETLTNSSALYIASGAVAPTGSVSNSYGLNVSAPTGATNNYAATFQGGNVGIGTTSPTAKLQTNGASSSSGGVTLTASSGATTFTTSSSVTLNAGDYIVPATTTGQARAVTTTATGTSFTVSSAFSAAVSGETYTVYPGNFAVYNSSGTAQFFVQGYTGNVGIGTNANTPARPLSIVGTTTNTSGSDYAENINYSYNPGSPSTSSGGALQSAGSYTSNQNSPSAAIGGVIGYGDNWSGAGGTVGTAIGVNGMARLVGTNANISTAKGLNGSVSISSGTTTGSIVTAYGIYSNITNSSATATITTGYGVYIGPVAGSTKWSLYSSDTAAPNYFGASVAIGTGGTTPSYPLDVTGDIRTSTCIRTSAGVSGGTCTSDERIKKDIRPFKLGLETILKIFPKYFKFNGLGGEVVSKNDELGVIAQEVEKAAPELVSTKNVLLNKSDKIASAIKTVNYNGFLYTVINAIRELYQKWFEDSSKIHREIAMIKKENEKLKKENLDIKSYLCSKDPQAKLCHQ